MSKWKHKVTSLIKAAHEGYVKSELGNSKDDQKKFWRHLNNLLGKNRSAGTETVSLTDDNNNIISPDQSANFLNIHFPNIGTQLTGPPKYTNIEDMTKDWEDSEAEDDFLLMILPDLRRLINDINIKKGSGIDGIATFILKDAFNAILPQLLFMFNC